MKIPGIWPVFVAGAAFAAILVIQLSQLAVNAKSLSSLEKKMLAFKSVYKQIDDMSKKKISLGETLSFLQRASAEQTSWSEKFYIINKSLPPQIWLTNITIESKTSARALPAAAQAKQKNNALATQTEISKTLILSIRGAATSLIEADIIGSITQYVDTLKKNSTFNQEFSDIKLGPLQSDKKGNLTVMKFVIYCKAVKL
ncbi:MAG: hypothetical protein MUC39_00715 [Candidatus Omnitrophica bacterium]|nr:hypothetical protein [Candidatus Omnitrophota bacterium]